MIEKKNVVDVQLVMQYVLKMQFLWLKTKKDSNIHR